MSSIPEIAAKLSDSLIDSEFKNNPDRLFLNRNPKELQRIQWIRSMDVRNREYGELDWQQNLRKRDREQYELATKLCKKLKLPYR